MQTGDFYDEREREHQKGQRLGLARCDQIYLPRGQGSFGVFLIALCVCFRYVLLSRWALVEEAQG